MRTGTRLIACGLTRVFHSTLPAVAIAGLTTLGLVLSGCRTGRPDYSVNVPPNLLAIRPQKSVVFVQTPVRLAALSQAIDRAIPTGTSQHRLGAFPLAWQVSRQPATIRPGAQGLEVRVPVFGELAIGSGFLSCRSSGIGGTLVIGGRPTLDPAFNLVLEGTQVRMEPAGNLNCGGLPVPVAQVFPLLLEPIQRGVTSAVSAMKLPLGPAIQRGLQEIGTPRPLKLAGQKACLDLAPSALVMAPMGSVGSGSEILLRLGVEVAPRVSLGDCPAGASAPALSSLSVREQALADTYRVQVAVAVPSVDLTTQLSRALSGKRLGSGSTALTVGAVEVGDQNGRVLVHLDVTGAYNGAIFLWGTPQVERSGERYTLTVPDLKLATESTSRLEDTKIALVQLFDGDLAEKIKPQLRLDVTDKLAQARAALSGTTALDRSTWQNVPVASQINGIALKSTISELSPLQVESRPGVVVIYVEAVGQMELIFQ